MVKLKLNLKENLDKSAQRKEIALGLFICGAWLSSAVIARIMEIYGII